MHRTMPAFLAIALLSSTAAIHAQSAQKPREDQGPMTGTGFTTTYIRLGRLADGLLYQPSTKGPKNRIAVVFTHPGADNLPEPIGRELSSRGYTVMNLNARANPEAGVDLQLPAMSAAIAYLRGLPGIERVVVAGHSGGAHQMTLYANVALHGAAACNGPEKLYACQARGLDHLERPDGLILLDPPLGDFHEASSIDPAVNDTVNRRDPALDMFSPANGFDAAKGSATYSADFARRFHAAQAARNAQVLAHAQARLKLIEGGQGDYANDEPLTIPGLGADAGGARLYQSDLAFLSHSKAPHLLLKADGTRAMQIIRTVRPASMAAAKQARMLGTNSQNTTVRGYLAHAAIRLQPDYAITDDDIVGVDWASGYDSAPGNAPGITVPTLVLTMGCHYLIVPGEIIYDRLATRDKTYATVEGATHGFTACRPAYGDTMKRTFDFVDEWLGKAGRF